MGSNKSHGKKSNKETQSPVLKIFKDMMQREMHDAEKTNLLESKSKKKHKKHSGSRSKSENKTESRSSGKRHKNTKQLINTNFENYSVNSSTPISGEKRESWWVWGDTTGDKNVPSDETYSCVSNALRKIISSNYACFACLAILLTISAIAAFLLIYKSIPCYKGVKVPDDNERLKRKIDLSGYRWDNAKQNGNQWVDGSIREIPRSMDFDGSPFQELKSAIDPNSELSKILDSDKLNEIQGSDRLREFYKKLIQADVQIRNLKKNNDLDVNTDIIENKFNTYPDRAKRSLSILQRPFKKFYYRNKILKNKETEKANDTTVKKDPSPNDNTKGTKQKNTKTIRNKRLENSTAPKDILFEDMKVYRQFQPYNRKSKCSHVPKESTSHENQLKHPFYQNSQKLGEILDKFLDNNLKEILTDPFGSHTESEEQKNKCKHPKIETDEKTTEASQSEKNLVKMDEAFNMKGEFQSDRNHINNKEIVSKTETISSHDSFNELELTEAEKKEKPTTNSYDTLMSASTMMYDHDAKNTNFLPLMGRVPNMRKLLQVEVDYDQNEVLEQDDDDDGEEDKSRYMKKRTDKSISDDLNKLTNAISVLNPNWKGPMPLYPDELNPILKQENIANKVEIPVQTIDTNNSPFQGALELEENIVDRVIIPVHKYTSKVDDLESNFNDMDYIEDYFRDKYERLIGLAQAYSDYGVLEGRKDSEKKLDVKKESGPKAKLTLSGIKERLKNSISGRPKIKSFLSEGFRFEIKPATASREDYIDMHKFLKQDVKLSEKQKQLQTIWDYIPTDRALPTDVNVDAVHMPSVLDLKSTTKDSDEMGFGFSIGKKRTLKSVISSNDEENYRDEFETKLLVRKDIDDISSTFDKYKREIDLVSPNDNPGDISTMINDVNNARKHLAYKLSVVKAIDDFRPSTFVRYKRKIDLVSQTDNPGHVKSDKIKDDVNTSTPADASSANNTDNYFSDFFMSLANSFGALDGVFNDSNGSSAGNVSLPNNATPVNILHKNDTENIIYPIYDSDMIENINHRSRVLLSEEDYNVTVNVDKDNDKETAVKDLGDGNADASKNLTNDILKIKTSNIEENNTKLVVKRNADDSLIFWNDIYDDEYGVTVDSLENNLRDTHTIDKNDIVKKPSKWFRDKVKKISDGLHKRARNSGKMKDTASNSEKKNKDKQFTDQKSKSKEPSNKKRIADKKSRSRRETDFGALTANMKKVCKKAAHDVRQTRTNTVRSKQEELSSSLMQQLVQLMTDLVDYQVQERTCRKLPPDLQSFLEWLTSPEQSESKKENSHSGPRNDAYPGTDFNQMNDKSEDDTFNVGSSREMEDKPDSRSDCLGTLQVVQDLMKEFEDLTDDDKLKITGVRSYLESQIQYLQNQLPQVDFNIYNTETMRYKRDTSSERNAHHITRKHGLKQKLENFMNRLKKQHQADNKIKTDKNEYNTKNNEASIKEKKTNNQKEGNAGEYFEMDKKAVKEKKNLRDVFTKL